MAIYIFGILVGYVLIWLFANLYDSKEEVVAVGLVLTFSFTCVFTFLFTIISALSSGTW